jgi:PIN domain nuclease of toxin-antitoxin system
VIVFDASALLAYLQREPGWDIVRDHFSDSAISVVNWAETLSKLADIGVNLEAVAAALMVSSLEIVETTVGQSVTAAQLRPVTRKFGLSLGDRYCFALARELESPILTAEQAWADVDLGVPVKLIRPPTRKRP